MSANLKLYSLNEAARQIGITYDKLRAYIRYRPNTYHKVGGRLCMNTEQIRLAKQHISPINKIVSNPKRIFGGGLSPYDTGTHVSARLAVMMVTDHETGKNLGGRAAEIVTALGIGNKIGDYQTAPVQVAKTDLPLLAKHLNARGYTVKSEYLIADAQQATQPPLPISVSRTDETAKLLGLTTEQAAELYLSLAADILERLK